MIKNQRAKKLPLASQMLKISFTVLLLVISLPAFAEEEANNKKQNVGENTGLPIPRFASLKSSNVNARSGPGDSYPIKAVYKRAGLPVEIVSEFKLWREIADVEGEHNWVHKAMLSGKRTAILKEDSFAYTSASSKTATAKLEKGAQIHIDECEQSYCLMNVDSAKGWIEKSKLWGVYPNEIFD